MAPRILKRQISFPEGFLFGAATSSYQSEGGNENTDWWIWEHGARRTKYLKDKDLDPAEYQSGIACDFYRRYEEDFALAASLHLRAIRLSVEWARIEPKEGIFNDEALAHYEAMLRAAKAHGFTIFLTLHHYTVPLWFAKKGGFAHKENITHFLHYARVTAKRLAPWVDFFVTINEPELYAIQGYAIALHPPQVRSYRAAWVVLGNLIHSHNLLAEYIQDHLEKPVSMAFNLTDLRPHGYFGKTVVRIANYLANEYVLRHTIDHCDYIGVNYYIHHHIGLFGQRKHSKSHHEESDRRWGIHPEGIARILLRLKRYKKPIYVLENGIADASDAKRGHFITEHLYHVHRAIARGADVRGYLYWSLTDNFEWEEGFWPRFGLIEIDREHGLARRVRKSAHQYAEICRTCILTLEP